MGYPKAMYRGSYTEHEVTADYLKVCDEKEEEAARADGYTDGHSFFSAPPKPVKPKGKKNADRT